MKDTPDTTETVAEKMKGVGLAMAAMTHYIIENHPGDWFDCWCYKGEAVSDEQT